MNDLFVDLWQPQQRSTRTGPLIPNTHLIRHPRKQFFIKQEIARLWQLQGVRAHNPAPNPVSIERNDLLRLQHVPYMVAEKTDGVRYLLLLTRYPPHLGGQPCAVMVDRKDDAYEVRVIAEEDYFQGSLFDGEMVWQYEHGQYRPPRQAFLVFDCVACRGVSLVRENLERRFKTVADTFDCGNKDVADDPRKWIETATELAAQHRVVCEGNQYCLTFRAKPLYRASHLDTVWRTRKTLHHQSDGLIFTPIDEPIRTGTHPTMYKWKSHHTIDVIWEANWLAAEKRWESELFFEAAAVKCSGQQDGIRLERPPEIQHSHSGDEVYPYDEVPLILIPSEYSDKVAQWHYQRGELQFSHIVECSCKLPHMTEWIAEQDIPMVECTVLKIRYDKLRPNQKHTIEKTLRNIRENISVKDLLDAVHVFGNGNNKLPE